LIVATFFVCIQPVRQTLLLPYRNLHHSFSCR
jgi:hypothetical protein